MLVENKFLFISIPRSASTSFHISCIRNNFDIQFCSEPNFDNLNILDIKNINNEELADNLTHPHEPLRDLELKFGNHRPIIAIKRDKYERFISLWKHVIDEFDRVGELDVVEKMKTMKIDDIIYFKREDILENNINRFVHQFLTKFDFKVKVNVKYFNYMVNVFMIVFNPPSQLHNHDPRIIWFNIKELNKLEEWVTNITGKEFKIEKINSSQHFDCNLVIDENFKKKYDSIYEIYENPKIIKTLL